MPKNTFVIVCLSIVLSSIFVEPQLFAQELSEKPVRAENIKNEQVLINEEITKNNFENLISAKQIVYQLQKNYGIQGSVLLSKALTQILNSYSNQQQAQIVWQTAINKVTDLNQKSSVPMLNPEYNIGQILNIYTHGMDSENWNASRSSFRTKKLDLNNVFSSNDDLTLYLNLDKIWELLLIDLAKKENIQWNEVFENSLDLFAQVDELSKNTNKKQENNLNILEQLLNWEMSPDTNNLADVVLLINKLNNEKHYLYQNIINLMLEKRAQHYMAASLAWFAVAEQLYLQKDSFSEQEVIGFNRFIEENDAWFLANENNLQLANSNLSQWVENSFHELKNYYGDPNTKNNSFALSLKSAYHMQGSQFNKYMNTPFRQEIRKKLEICLNISEESEPLPQLPIDAKQFNGCVNDMVLAATQEAGSRELSGALTKVDAVKAMKRALQLPPWQIINILYANVANDGCLDTTNQLVNPLEWSMAAESLLWFADRWPAYSQKYPHNNLIDKVILQGQKLDENLPCLEDSKQNILNAKFIQISQSWQDVKSQIQNVVNEFNVLNLAEGSDINLLTSSELPSNFRIEDFKITACDAQNSCGVHVELESSRALFGLFPNHLLVAHQLKLGKLNLCYGDVGWENRRSTSTHLDNDSVANYFGNFSFSLKGFYDDDMVFEKKIIDSQEYLYLFAENSEKVSNIVCPLEIVGSKISTQLKRGTFGLVPNRLTFLTASRANESDILLSNWSKGEEWKDEISSSKTINLATNDLDETKIKIQAAYQQKAVDLQEIVYQLLLKSKNNSTEAQQKLSEAFAKMQFDSQVFYALSYILRTDDVMMNDKLHGIFFGENKLSDYKTISEFYQNQINIKLLLSGIDENLQINKQKWNSLEQSLSYSHIRNIIYQLRSLKQ